MIIYNNKKVVLKLSLILLALILLILAIYFCFFYYKTCSDLDCYLSYQQACKKAVFLNTQDSNSFEYKIKGETNGFCKIEVTAKDFYQGYTENLDFKDKSMICSIEEGSIQLPDSDLKKCSGQLKEEFLYLMIEKLYVEIYENIKDIK